jgi:hypothetical protein
VSMPGIGSVDVAKLQEAGERAKAFAESAQSTANGTPSAPVAVIDPKALQALLPAGVSGLQRTAQSTASAGAAGIGGSQAEASYGSGAGSIKLSVADLGVAGALAAVTSAFNVQGSKEDEHGYERVDKIDGRMTTEKWNNDSRSGTYSVIVADRFLVSADGQAGSIDVLKSAVSQVDFGTLERLAKS